MNESLSPAPEGQDLSLTVVLARRAQAGDLGRFNDLCARLMPALYGWAALRIRGPLRSRIEPDEIVQETWERAVRRFETFDEARASFRAWLFGIANNVLLEALRALQQRSQHQASDTSRVFVLDQAVDVATSISLRAARSDAMHRFLAHVEELGEEERKLVVLCGLEGLTTAEAGRAIGIGAEAAKKRWQRLRAELAQRAFPSDLLA